MKKKAGKSQPHTLLETITKVIDKEKLADVVTIDLAGKTAIADYMIVASGTSGRQLAAVASRLRDTLSAEKCRVRIEGQAGGDWVIVDAGDVIVHLFRPEVRKFYELEKLWATDFSTVGYNKYTSD